MTVESQVERQLNLWEPLYREEKPLFRFRTR